MPHDLVSDNLLVRARAEMEVFERCADDTCQKLIEALARAQTVLRLIENTNFAYQAEIDALRARARRELES